MSDLNNLVCVLFNGSSAAGKTQTARGIAAPQGLGLEENYSGTLVSWDFRPLASTLAEMHSIKVDVQGNDYQSRQLWMLHQVLTDLFFPNSVDFDDFIELLYDIASYPLNITYDSNDRMVRDRDFMTTIADACHSLKPNIFANNLTNKILQDFKVFTREHQDLDAKKIVIVPDLRLMPELESFEKIGCKLIKIRFEIPKEVQESRMIQRDGKQLTPKQQAHPTQSFQFDDSLFDLTIDCASGLSLKDQISMTKAFITNTVFPRTYPTIGPSNAQY